MKKSRIYSILRIVLFYVLFGALWIALSDRIVGALIDDPQKLSEIQTYKGLIYVLASALFVYYMVWREFRGREKAEQGLQVSEGKYQTLVALANDAILVFDAETGIVLDANKRAEELFGMPAEKIIGKHQLDLHPENDADHCRKIFSSVLQSGKMLVEDVCVSHRTGRVVPIEISMNVVTVGGRRIVQGIFRDITERKRALEELEREKNKAQLYLDIARVIIVVIDADQTVILINKQGSEILGYREEDIVGKNWFDHFIPERKRAEVKATFDKLIRGEESLPEYFENPVLTSSGEERTIAWHNTILRNEAGAVTATLSSGEDITVRKQAEEQAQSRLERLSALHAIDMMITSSLDLRITLNEFLNLIISQLKVDAADIFLLNPYTQTLELAAQRGFPNPDVGFAPVRLGEGVPGRAALEHRSISIANLREHGEEFTRREFLEREGFVAYEVIPLMAKGRVKGVLEIFHRASFFPNEEWENYVEALAAQAAIAIDNAELFNHLQQSNAEIVLAYDTTIEGWSRALELRDKETEGHTKRVTEMTVCMARAMGISEEKIVHVRRGALLHDIGKMSVPDSILHKTGPLTEQEWEIMRRHPVNAFEMLSPIAYLRPALDIPYCHHEWWDGTGYPRGLKGEQIPLAARIFALADTWDALVSKRRYHEIWSEDRIREHIRGQTGTHFDPGVVEIFLSMTWQCYGVARS